MGNTTGVVPVTPGTLAETKTLGRLNSTRVPFKVFMSSSYATGGDLISIQSGTILDNMKLWAVNIFTLVDPTKTYFLDWNGGTLFNSSTASLQPRIQAFTAVPGTEVTAATNLSTVQVIGELVYMY